MIRLFKVFVPTSVLALLLAEIVLITCCYLLGLIAALRDRTDIEVFLSNEAGFERIGLVVGSVLFGLYLLDLYTSLRVKSKFLLIQQLCLVIGIVFLGQGLVTYIDPTFALPPNVAVVGSSLVMIALPLWRVLYESVVLKGGDRVLFAGDSPIVPEIVQKLVESPELGLTPIGYLADSDDSAVSSLARLGTIRELVKVVAEVRPDRIVVGMAERRQKLPVYDLLDLRLSGIRIEEAATTYETAFGRISTPGELKPSQLIFSTARTRTAARPSAACVLLLVGADWQHHRCANHADRCDSRKSDFHRTYPVPANPGGPARRPFQSV